MRLRTSSTKRFHRTIVSAALADERHPYVQHNAIDHFVAANEAGLAARWVLTPETIMNRLNCSEPRISRWLYQVDGLRILEPSKDLDTLGTVLFVTADWLERDPSRCRQTFVQGLFETALDSPLAQTIQATLPNYPDTLFVWSSPPVWWDRTQDEVAVSLAAIFRCKEEPVHCSWGISHGRFLIGRRGNAIDDLSGEPQSDWLCFDIITNAPHHMETDTLRELVQAPSFSPLSEPISALGGQWGTVTLDGVSVELGFGTIHVLAQSSNYLLAWSQKLYLLQAKKGWTACSEGNHIYRLFQRQLLPSWFEPEGELECGIVLGQHFVYVARNTGVQGHKSSFRTEFWELTDTGLHPVDLYICASQWIPAGSLYGPVDSGDEPFLYEYPAERVEIKATPRNGETLLTVTVFDEYSRPHGAAHKTTRPFPVAGEAHFECFHNSFFTVFSRSYGESGDVDGQHQQWAIESHDKEAYLAKCEAEFAKRFKGLCREEVYDVVLETWKSERLGDFVLTDTHAFVFFPDDFNVLQIKWGSDFRQ